MTQEIYKLPFDEKLELQRLLEQNIIEERRNEIYDTYLDSKKLIAEGKANYSSDISELKKMLEAE